MIDLLLTALGIALAGYVVVLQLPVVLIKHYTVFMDVAYFAMTFWLALEVGGQQLATAALFAGVIFTIMLHITKMFVRIKP